MKARLSIHVPDEAVHERELATPANLIIGRDPQCDLVISHHSISRRHLRLDALLEPRLHRARIVHPMANGWLKILARRTARAWMAG